jgi:N-acetylmuramoyl-L-alanine amidase
MLITRRLLMGAGVKATFLLPGSVLAAAPSHRTAPVRGPKSAPARELPLVMLDPGHGGKDPGAIGVSGTYEKHISLATAFELKRQLEASGRYRVQLTRPRDVFIALEDRVAIAQKARATLFVSMHADAVHDHDVRGASVYTLGTASDAQSAALAQRENAADRYGVPGYKGLSPAVEQILASLVRRETRVGSARMAHSVVQAFDGDVRLLPNPARHAGFVVLKAADIPSVLVEMGFMSNPQDEAALRRPAHRVQVAKAMKNAVDAWFASAGQSLTQAG